ncbi:MAG: hypothetical protein H6667_14680 [Ardenticatenaceae bacterium]|nr:hypothetical protein [Ardenticatenaceae bacterium]MCB9445510.1 hypothetical protein [Ardenticatenaceae bacterium]
MALRFIIFSLPNAAYSGYTVRGYAARASKFSGLRKRLACPAVAAKTQVGRLPMWRILERAFKRKL